MTQTPRPPQDVLDDAIVQEIALARTGRPDHVHVLQARSVSNRKHPAVLVVTQPDEVMAMVGRYLNF